MDASCDFTRCKKIYQPGTCVRVYLYTAILIMQGWIYEHRNFTYIYIVSFKLSEFRWEILFDKTFSFQQIYHRRIKPDPFAASRCFNTQIPFLAFSYNSRRFNVSWFQGINKLFTVNI